MPDFRNSKFLTQSSPTFVRTNAGFCSGGQFIELIRQNSTSILEKSALNVNWRSEYLKSETIMLIIIVQSLFSLRISEVLRINFNEFITDYGQPLVLSKTNKKVILKDQLLNEIFANYKANSVDPFYKINRQYVRRAFLDIGIYYQKANGANKSVTHAFRQLNAKTIRESKISNEFISSQLNHNSKKSQQYYGK